MSVGNAMTVDPCPEFDGNQRQAQRLAALTRTVATDMTRLRRVVLDADVVWPTLKEDIDRAEATRLYHETRRRTSEAQLWQKGVKIRALMLEAEAISEAIMRAQRCLDEVVPDRLPRLMNVRSATRRLKERLVATWQILPAVRPVEGPERVVLTDRALILASGLFDAGFYATNYPDLRATSIDLVDHYLRHGGQEGRSASRLFDSARYIAANPDVGAAAINPLLHFILHGVVEGRSGGVLFADLPVPTSA